jgi:SseB protein N-terminal domain
MFKHLFHRSAKSTPVTSLPDPKSLLLAMDTVAKNDAPDSRVRLYREFLKSWLWFCVPELPDGLKAGMTVVPTGMNILVATPLNAKGEKVLPVFTEPRALANYDPNSPYLALPGVEIFKMALKLGVVVVVVNPFDPLRKPLFAGGTLSRREVEALAQGMIPERTPDGKGQVLVVQKGTQVQIGRCPDPISGEIKARLESTAARLPELQRIVRYRMRYVDTGAVSEVFAVDCSACGDRFHEIMSNLMSCIQPCLAPDHYVDFTKLSPSNMRLAQSQSELVYEREAASASTK